MLALVKITNDLDWHRKIGWTIAGSFAFVFGAVLSWLLISYIPDKISDKVAAIDNKIPSDFTERFGKMEANLQNMQDRLNHLTPASLNDLIPSPSTKLAPAMVAMRLRKASRVIDVALKTEIPAAPGSLAQLQMRVADIQKRYGSNPRIRATADSTNVRLSGYEAASRQMLSGHMPVSQSPSGETFPAIGQTIRNLNVDCTYPSVHFLVIDDSSVAQKMVLINVHLKTCIQNLGGPRWLDDRFNDSTLEYDGGPLYLADVTFANCKFKFGSDPNSKAALAAIVRSKGAPVSLLIQ